tara:strand:+ start:1033 stop:1869 length:837 start_codon:yes stop_codon:yes gene_type:complete
MLGRIRREAEKLTVNGSGIQGIESISANYDSVGASPLSNLGINTIQYAPQGPQTATLNVNTLLTHQLPSNYGGSRDVMQNFTGDIAFSGIIDYGKKQLKFNQAYLESYSVSCGIGEVPKTSTTSVIYGDFGTGNYVGAGVTSLPVAPQLAIPSYNSMEINLDEFITNRVSSFSIDVATPRVPVYIVGLDRPTGVIAGTPIEVNVNFVLEVDDYEIKNMRMVPEETIFRNTKITLNKNNSNTKLLEYSFDNMLLTSESFQASAEGNAGVNFNLRSFILR